MKLLCLYAFLKVERKGEVVYFCQFTSEQDGLFAELHRSFISFVPHVSCFQEVICFFINSC